ncbi:MAG: LPXTG cell wall anchor domain-containing protein [Candidatus Symbiothrix sp.]|jgi:LPXTG-motif cell wall-anchored protein|nr:LPXTG cell wall anchor domain-containing protein [Candidatus Symbiothrix sp.]
MKKIILSIAIVLIAAVAISAAAPSDLHRDLQKKRFIDRQERLTTSSGNSGSLRLDAPGTEQKTDQNQTGALGEGLLLLSALAGVYAARKKRH